MRRARRTLVTLAVAAAMALSSTGVAAAHGGNFDRPGRIDPTLPNCRGILNSMHARDDGGIAHSVDVRFGRHPGFDQPETVQGWQMAVRVHCGQES